MHRLMIAAAAAMFVVSGALAQTTPASPPMDASKKSDPNTPMGKDREAMPKTKSAAPTAGAPMPKDEMQKKK